MMAVGASEIDLMDVLGRMARAAASAGHLTRLGRLFSETVLIQVDDAEYFVSFEKGYVVEIKEGPSQKTPWRFALRLKGEALRKFWEPIPEPGYHDIFGLVKFGHARIDGDVLMLVKNLRFFKEFMALGRVGAVA